MAAKLKDIGEIGLIDRIASRTPVAGTVVKGIGDDTAVISWNKDKYLLATCDMLVEGVHFRKSCASAKQIGWKAMARNLSDIAAMGGRPLYAMVSVGISPDENVKFADELYLGMLSAAKKYGVSIVGGDTAKSKDLVIDISMLGEAKKKELVLRSGAKEGDTILVTGSVGGSLKGKHLDFTPRVEASRRLVSEFRVNSMIDVSDGLLIDLGRILKAGSAGAHIHECLIPVSGAADSFRKAVTDGEDFELLFTMPPREADRLLNKGAAYLGVNVSAIGSVRSKKYGYRITYENGATKKIEGKKGYLHF